MGGSCSIKIRSSDEQYLTNSYMKIITVIIIGMGSVRVSSSSSGDCHYFGVRWRYYSPNRPCWRNSVVLRCRMTRFLKEEMVRPPLLGSTRLQRRMFLRLQRWIFLAPPAKPDMHQFRSNLSFFMLNVMRMMAAIEKVL